MLAEQIQADLTTAMKARDRELVSGLHGGGEVGLDLLGEHGSS